MNGYGSKLQILATIWLLTLMTFIIVRAEIVDESQVTIGLIIGAVVSIVLARLGIRLVRNGNGD